MPKAPAIDKSKKKQYTKTQPVRLYQKGIFTGFRRYRIGQNLNQTIIHIQNCKDRSGAKFYQGKKVAYIQKVKNTVNNTRFRVQWGKVMAPHGNAGAVRCNFSHNLPPKAMGGQVRVMLYPNKTIWARRNWEQCHFNYQQNNLDSRQCLFFLVCTINMPLPIIISQHSFIWMTA